MQIEVVPENSVPYTKQAFPLTSFYTLFFGSLALLPVSMVIGCFDTTTVLIPTHENLDRACLAIAALCSVLSCGTAVYLTSRLSIIQRIMLPLVIMFETAVSIFMTASHIAYMVQGRFDFPAGTTTVRQVLFPISRAYRTTGKSSSQYIQIVPFWSTLEISRADFSFMQNHQRSGDTSPDPDHIASQGYFCAKVTIEETRKSLRILHAGSGKLPEGTVTLCPPRPLR